MSASNILLTTIHVITDWPKSDHMIGTSHIGPCPSFQMVSPPLVYDQPKAGHTLYNFLEIFALDLPKTIY
ncbi:unnamed protein product [Staurois parvus]|uniref:Uncharacterized protein n=1 Tax=Staurois parvus TaxID=386267 RepID=A0ABN9C6R2_9NEOB|nr:unnamed protein product [Staurois parvus]